MPAHRTRKTRKIHLRIRDVHADIGALHRRAAALRDADLVLPVVVVGPVVVHHHQHRDPVFRGDPQCARVEHQVAVGLNVDHQAFLVPVRERRAKRGADLGRGAEGVPRVAVGAVIVPQPVAPPAEIARGKHPVLVLDDAPDFRSESRRAHRP